MKFAELIPPVERTKGGKERLGVSYRVGGKTKHQPIVLPPQEKRRLEREAARRGVSMSDMVIDAVHDLAREFAPVPGSVTDAIASLAGTMGMRREDVAARVGVRGQLFARDLRTLAGHAGSMSRAARWALAVYYERS